MTTPRTALSPQQLNKLLSERTNLPKMADSDLSSPFLRLLSNAGRDVTAQLLAEEAFQAGQIIFAEGAPGDSMYIIWSGRAAVLKGDLASPTVLGYRGVGDIIGEMALLEDQPRSASVVALEHLRTLKIERKDFERLLSKNPMLSISILGTISARLRAADDARKTSLRSETSLIRQVAELQSEKQQLLELERLRQDTIDLIVHDLRHPISSLMGAVKILEMVLPAEILQANRQLLNIANLNCDQLQLMVDSLLDVARMESGKSELDLEPIDLKQLIDDNIDRAKIAADMENIAIETVVADDLPGLEADYGKVTRILSNLLHNAIKYTPPNDTVVVEASATSTEVMISVIDAGPGVPPEDSQRIFDRYTRLSGNQTRLGGFGLGLAFCKLAVEAHGGKIWVEPKEEGSGSKFSFTVPLVIEA